MALISDPIVVKTPAQIAADLIRMQSYNLWRRMIDTQIGSFDLVWHNSQATPQEVMDALGTDGVELFENAAALVQCILTVKHDALTEYNWKPPFVYVPNNDGTVTITNTPAV